MVTETPLTIQYNFCERTTSGVKHFGLMVGVISMVQCLWGNLGKFSMVVISPYCSSGCRQGPNKLNENDQLITKTWACSGHDNEYTTDSYHNLMVLGPGKRSLRLPQKFTKKVTLLLPEEEYNLMIKWYHLEEWLSEKAIKFKWKHPLNVFYTYYYSPNFLMKLLLLLCWCVQCVFRCASSQGRCTIFNFYCLYGK